MLGALGLNMQAKKVYFENTSNWTNIYAHHWTENGSGTSWPGDNIKNNTETIGGKTYYFIDTEDEKVIFNNNNGTQTGDLLATDCALFRPTNTDNNPYGIIQDGEVITSNYYTIYGPIMNHKNNNNDWIPAGMKRKGDDWVIENVKLKSGNFRIRRLTAGSSAINIASAEGNTTVVKGVPHNTKQNGGDFWWANSGQPYTLTYSPNTNTFTITDYLAEGEEPKPDVEEYMIRGNLSGDWTDYSMTEVNGVWVSDELEVTIGGASFGVKFAVNKEEKGWYNAKSSDKKVSGSKEVTCVSSGGENFEIDPGKYKFEFNPQTLVLKITGTSIELNEYTVYFKNTNNWANVYAYCWTPELAGSWPGTKLEAGNDGLYAWTIKSASEPTMEGFQFNNGLGKDNGGVDTGDISGSDYKVGSIYNASGKIVSDEIQLPVLYLRGDFFGWDPSDDSKLSPSNQPENDGRYVYTKEVSEYTGKFKIDDGTWDGTNSNFSSEGSEFILNQEMKAVHNKDNFEVPSTKKFTGTIKFYYDPNDVNHTLIMAGVLDDLKIDYTTWTMEIQTGEGKAIVSDIAGDSEGMFTVEEVELGNTPFMIVLNGDTHYNAIVEGNALKNEIWTKVKDAYGSSISVEDAKEGNAYTIEFNAPEEQVKITLTSSVPEPETRNIYVVGAYNNWGNDANVEKVQLQPIEGQENVYTASSTTAFSAGEWKLYDGTWEWSFGVGANFEPDVDNETWFDGGNFPALIPTTEGNEVTVTFTLVEGSEFKYDDNPERTASLIRYSGAMVEEPVYSYALHGSIFGEEAWSGDKGWTTKLMTEENGRWVFVGKADTQGNFGIQKLNNGEQVGWINSPSNDTTAILDVENECTDADGENFWLAEAGNYIFTFDPVNMTLLVERNMPFVEMDTDAKEQLNVSVKTGHDLYYHVFILDMNERPSQVRPLASTTVIGDKEYTKADESDDMIGSVTSDEENGKTIYTFNTSELLKSVGKTDLSDLQPNERLTVSLYSYDPINDLYSDETEVGIRSGGATTGIEDITADDDDATYFNLSGVKVTNPATPGVYIRVQGTKTTKVIVK